MLFCAETRRRLSVWAVLNVAGPQVVFRFTKQGHRGEPGCVHIGILIVKTMIPSFFTSPPSYHLTTKCLKEMVACQSKTAYIYKPHTAFQPLTQLCCCALGQESHSDGLPCFRPLTTNCIFLKSKLDMSVAHHQV